MSDSVRDAPRDAPRDASAVVPVGRIIRTVLALAAAHAAYVGSAMLVAPERYYAPMGLDSTPLVAMVIRAQGATWIGLSVVMWLSRTGERRQASVALAANLVVQLTGTVVAVHGRAHLPRAALLFDVAGHALLALVFGVALAATQRQRVATR